MIQIVDDEGRALAVLDDEGQPQQVDDAIKSWWTDGVPGRESNVTEEGVADSVGLVKPSDPYFGLAIGDEVERRGWTIEDGVAEKGYTAVQDEAHGGHWVTLAGGRHILLQERPPEPKHTPSYSATMQGRRNVQNAVQEMSGASYPEGFEALTTALDDFLEDPDGNDATRLRCVAAKVYGGRVLTSYGAAPLTAQAVSAAAGTKDGKMLARAVKAQYEETQRVLKELYPSGFITLYRGVRNSKNKITAETEVVDVDSNALESWTTDRDIAGKFAKASKTGAVLEAHIPLASVWASYHSQPDLHRMAEKEAIVLGDHTPFRSRVIMHMGHKGGAWLTE